MTSPSPNRLVTALQVFRPGRILQMGDLKNVQSGLALYERSAVEWVGWRGAERVQLKIGKDHIAITLDKKGNIVCKCKRCDQNDCRHSVAVMATVSHALRGKMGLSSRSFPPDIFGFIRDALFEGPQKSVAGRGRAASKSSETARQPSMPPIRIVQDGNGELDAIFMMPRASLSLRGSGSFSSPAVMRQLPSQLRDLFAVPMMVAFELEEVLFEFISENLGDFPVVIDHLDGDAEPAKVDAVMADPLAGLSRLRRHADSDSVEVEFVAAVMELGKDNSVVVTSDDAIQDFYRLGKTLIYLPEKRTLGRVVASEIWESQSHGDVDDFVRTKLFQRYHKTKERKPFKPVQALTKTIEEQNRQPFSANKGSASALLVRYYDGDSTQPITPLQQSATVKLVVKVDSRSGTVRLSGEVDAHADVSAAFDEICEHLEALDESTSSASTRLTTLFAEYRIAVGQYLLCRDHDERVAIANAFMERVGSDKRSNRSRYHYDSTFEGLEDLLGGEANSVTLAALPKVGDDGPSWVSVDPVGAILDALAVCYKHLPGFRSSIVEEPDATGSMTELVIAARDWKAGIAGFSAECAQFGIALTVDGKYLETVSLDFQVRAEPVAAPTTPNMDGDRIDWFALHPKIFCDEVDVPEDQWATILQGGTFQSEGADGIIRVVDSESLERFALFLRAGAGAGGTSAAKPDAQDAVKVPRLQILDWMQLKKKGIEIILPDEDAAIIDSLLSGRPGNSADMPETIQATLRPYQIAGYRWMAFLYEHRFGAVLADDMGLGKTLQTITLLAALDAGLVAHRPSERQPHLAVLPPSLIFNWRSEIERFLPGVSIYEYTGGKRSLEELRKADIVLTTYELARRDIEKLEHERFDVIIFDEAQAAKNIAAARTKAIRRLRGRFRLCLTGTPLENHVGEYFAILDLALPGLFGEGEDAKKALRASSDAGNERYLRRAQPFVLRRTKENVLKDLPPKVESDIYLDLDRAQKEFYTRTVAEVRAEVAQAFAHKPKQQAGIVALSALMRLRQICVAPGVIDPSIKSGSAPKLDHLVEKLQELHEEGHAALVFSQFTRVLDLIEPLLTREKLSFVRLDGQTPQKMRKHHVDRFQAEDGPDIFLISLKAGGAGLNLTRASYVFHLDPWWNPAVERQASDRAHRIGQKNNVFIHRILMRDTIEEKMMILKARKQELYDEIMGSAEAEGERVQSRKAPMITQEDIGFLLGE